MTYGHIDESFPENVLDDNDPSNEELQRIETVSIKAWDKIKCINCKTVFSIITAKWRDGNVECPRCKKQN